MWLRRGKTGSKLSVDIKPFSLLHSTVLLSLSLSLFIPVVVVVVVFSLFSSRNERKVTKKGKKERPEYQKGNASRSV